MAMEQNEEKCQGDQLPADIESVVGPSTVPLTFAANRQNNEAKLLLELLIRTSVMN